MRGYKIAKISKPKPSFNVFCIINICASSIEKRFVYFISILLEQNVWDKSHYPRTYGSNSFVLSLSYWKAFPMRMNEHWTCFHLLYKTRFGSFQSLSSSDSPLLVSIPCAGQVCIRWLSVWPQCTVAVFWNRTTDSTNRIPSSFPRWLSPVNANSKIKITSDCMLYTPPPSPSLSLSLPWNDLNSPSARTFRWDWPFWWQWNLLRKFCPATVERLWWPQPNIECYRMSLPVMLVNHRVIDTRMCTHIRLASMWWARLKPMQIKNNTITSKSSVLSPIYPYHLLHQ